MNVRTSSAKDLLGIDIDICRKWIKLRISPEMNCCIIHDDYIRPLPSFFVSKEEELKQGFNWKNTQLPLKKKTISKRVEKLISSNIDCSLLKIVNSSN